MLPVKRIHDALASTFDVSAQLHQLKSMCIQDITPGTTTRNETEFSDFFGAFQTFKWHVTLVWEPFAQAVAGVQLIQKFNDFAQRLRTDNTREDTVETAASSLR
ncbi:hypothetical protein cyc_00719 [Cyclospora cayetanensis]|uniref:Uncharacterized protein n=1 Tax=Cyclospora cayetanensis TaxID=88456 RepID=A0A1D3CWM1_9EIME|nr:hypothetical protein cyc_00719 [Cyclospora cayetanensis]